MRRLGTLHSLLLLRPTGRRKYLSRKGKSLSADRDAQRGAGQKQPAALLPGFVAGGKSSHSCPEAACSQEGIQLQTVAGHKQLQAKDSKVQMQDKISMISVEIFMLCCCSILIKTCTFRYSD